MPKKRRGGGTESVGVALARFVLVRLVLPIVVAVMIYGATRAVMEALGYAGRVADMIGALLAVMVATALYSGSSLSPRRLG